MSGKPQYDYKKVLALFEEHQNVPDTAFSLGCNRKTVEKVLREHGIVPSRKPRRHVYTKDHPVNDQEVIRAMYVSGMSARVIAKKIGTSYNTILSKMKEFGIEARTKSDSLTGHLHPHWNGGEKTDSQGYVEVLVGPRKYKYKHRLVMEEHLGRNLLSHEIVHHIDENPSNNDISNLELLQSVSEHMSDGRHARMPLSQSARSKISQAMKATWDRRSQAERDQIICKLRSGLLKRHPQEKDS